MTLNDNNVASNDITRCNDHLEISQFGKPRLNHDILYIEVEKLRDETSETSKRKSDILKMLEKSGRSNRLKLISKHRIDDNEIDLKS